MNFIDMKYVNVLSARLPRFKIKNNQPYRANFRCPICGDSQRSESKARGWILEKDHDHSIFYCHNCNASMGLPKFIKAVDPTLYNDYTSERALDNLSTKTEEENSFIFKTPAFKKRGSPLLPLKKISQLSHDHKIKKYILKRQIPSDQHFKIYYAPKFVEWTNSILSDKLEMKEHSRIVLPFIDNKGIVFGYQGRALSSDQLRYITIMIDETMPKIFGLDTIDFNKKYYIVEGPIDSLFLKNSIAMAGSSINDNTLQRLENSVFVYDNEPRNKQILDKMSKTLASGYKICIWPDIAEKDINDMVLAGLDPQNIINDNTYSGLEGEMKLIQWRRA